MKTAQQWVKEPRPFYTIWIGMLRGVFRIGKWEGGGGWSTREKYRKRGKHELMTDMKPFIVIQGYLFMDGGGQNTIKPPPPKKKAFVLRGMSVYQLSMINVFVSCM